MTYTIRNTGNGWSVLNSANAAVGDKYKSETQAKRRARDLNRKLAAQQETDALGKKAAESQKAMAAKSSSAVKRSPAKKAAASVKRAPTKVAAVKPELSEATKTAALAGVDKVADGKKPNKTETAAIAKVVENGKKNGKASTAVKAPDAAAPKPKLCKAVPKQIDGKPVSNYRGVRLAIEAEGPEAGLAHGLALGLPLSQVKAYVKELLAIIEKAKNKPPKGEKKTTAAARTPYEPDFRFDDREKAWSHAVSQARRCGFAEANFHILEEGGKFAVAPIHYKPAGEVPTFEKGDTVMDTIIKDSRAKVIEAGPEVCVVEYDSKKIYTTPQAVPNVYLYKIGGKEAKVTPDTAPRKMKPLVEAGAVEKAAKPAKKAAKAKKG